MCADVRETGPRGSWYAATIHDHIVQFYESEDYLLDMLAEFVRASVSHGDASVIVATGHHLDNLERRLDSMGFDFRSAVNTGQVLPLEAAALLNRIMDGETLVASKFDEEIGDTIGALSSNWPAVRVFGELVALTTVRSNHAATMEIERCWNDLQKRVDFTLCCAYPLSGFTGENSATMMQEICDVHDAVYPAESVTELPTCESRLQAISMLQHKASRLEHEVAQRRDADARLRLALEAERDAREQAEAALRMRDQFVSVAAHELKTPLTSLIGHVQLVNRWIGNRRQIDVQRLGSSLQTISRQAIKLGQLVNQLLDVSRLEAGQLSIGLQPLDLSRLVRQVVHDFKLGEPAYEFVINVPDEVPVLGDELRLEQVLVNLLGNAVRFSLDESRILIAVSILGSDWVELVIRDWGIGIADHDLERVFEPYYQAHEQQSHSGMGLGLHISKQIVTMHGGDMSAESPEDGGTLMRVRLPAQFADNS